MSGTKIMLRNNQPDGFECPGCAWPDPKHTSAFEFCENGAKAVTWEATDKRAKPEVFAQHSVTELLSWTYHAIETLGWLAHPMVCDRIHMSAAPAPGDAPDGGAVLTAVADDIPNGSAAAYYPEDHVLNSLEYHDSTSGTPAYKSVPVRVGLAAV